MTQKQKKLRIDFEQWSQLAKSDPESFEALRNETLAACIEQAPKDRQQRLRCLQWRIDRVRERASNPLAACITISGMMWDTVHQLGDTCRKLHMPPAAANVPARATTTTSKSAAILPFRAPPPH